jgi:hypothetical protein
VSWPQHSQPGSLMVGTHQRVDDAVRVLQSSSQCARTHGTHTSRSSRHETASCMPPVTSPPNTSATHLEAGRHVFALLEDCHHAVLHLLQADRGIVVLRQCVAAWQGWQARLAAAPCAARTNASHGHPVTPTAQQQRPPQPTLSK